MFGASSGNSLGTMNGMPGWMKIIPLGLFPVSPMPRRH